VSRGTQLAAKQLAAICQASDAVEEVQTFEPKDDSAQHIVVISVRVGRIPTAPDGIRFRHCERFTVFIPASFPFEKPSVHVTHGRFAGYPHVQWRNHICLYQAASEWNPSDGMHGLLDRLHDWISSAALNQLDPDDAPLHPPAVYTQAKLGKSFVPKANAPESTDTIWLGFAQLQEHEHRIDISGWIDFSEQLDGDRFAPAILFTAPMPWEYPSRGRALIEALLQHGVDARRLRALLRLAALAAPPGEPMYIVVGAPMRRLAGGPRRQHLAVWALTSESADQLRLTVAREEDSEELEQLRSDLTTSVLKVLELSEIYWCPVLEARAEVTIRRDIESTTSIFRDKIVAVWGCGALGANVALALARAGAKKLVLVDRANVTPGILVRQPYFEADVGRHKVDALKAQLRAIRSELDVDERHADVVSLFRAESFDWFGADYTIDATASGSVRQQLEAHRPSTAPLAAIMIDQEARSVLVTIVGAEYSGFTWDSIRKTKVSLLATSSPEADLFFPAAPPKAFQPEPGCSEPTFVGSATDSAVLAGIGLNLAASEWASQRLPAAVTHVHVPPRADATSVHRRITHEPDFCLELNDYEVRIERSAMDAVRAVIRDDAARLGNEVETGGLLWGEWDDATRTVWVSMASPPPPDSRHSRDGFVCGIEGSDGEWKDKEHRFRGAGNYVGMWHTHPVSTPLPSTTDFGGMGLILTEGRTPPRRGLMVIVGRHAGRDAVGVAIFAAGTPAVFKTLECQLQMKVTPSPMFGALAAGRFQREQVLAFRDRAIEAFKGARARVTTLLRPRS